MKRYLWLTVVMVFLLCAAACQKKEKGPELGEKSKFTAEDYQEKNRNLISTDK